MSPGLILVIILVIALLGGFGGRVRGYGWAWATVASVSSVCSDRRHCSASMSRL